MTLAFLASLIAFMLFLSISIRHQNRLAQEKEKRFWEREARANSIRRKSLDGLSYIKIPLETFPTHILQNDSTVQECISTLEVLTSQKIVNLTGYTNTDLKLEYGTANITVLSEYDQNYTVLVRTLQKWADILLETGYVEEAVILMEFAAALQNPARQRDGLFREPPSTRGTPCNRRRRPSAARSVGNRSRA